VFDDGRPLGAVEHLYRLLDDAGGARFAVVARLRGPADPERLRGALVGLRERHPLLGCRVDRRGGALAFRRSGVPETPLTLPEPEGWPDGVLNELARPLDVGRGPLLRARLAASEPDSSTITLTFDHCAADGRAASRAAIELFDAMISEAISSTDPVGSFESLQPSLETFLPARTKGLRGLLRYWALQTRRSLGHLLRGPPRRLRADARAPWWDHRPGLAALELDRDQTGRLLRTARRRGTTIHGALCAAQLRAVAGESGRRRRLMLSHPADLRGRGVPEDAGGLQISGLDTLHRVGPDTEQWPLAQAVRRDLDRALDRGEGRWTLPVIAAACRRLAGLLGARRTARVMSLAAPYATTVSNLGDLGGSDQGPLTDLRFAFCPPPPFLFGSIASTWAGRLAWTFCWREPAVSAERGQRLADRSLALLLESLDKG